MEFNMPATGRDAQTRARARSTPNSRLRSKAQKKTAKALETLARLMEDEGTPATIRLAAAREVLDRGHGRPKLGPAEEPGGCGMTVIVKRYSDVTDEELARSEEGEP
jgi:hypothetical protein